eukprot:scaffold468_cov430-Prasinococcus_capsulatus_cf.AAC.1
MRLIGSVRSVSAKEGVLPLCYVESVGASQPHSHSCREGSCDCDMVFDHLDGHFPAVCNVKNLLMELEPYRETYARRQITVTFSLYDKPWFTASNESIFDYKGRIPLESVLPTRYASIPVRTAMQSGRPCCIAGSGLAAGWSRAIGLGGYSTKASEIACQVSLVWSSKGHVRRCDSSPRQIV